MRGNQGSDITTKLQTTDLGRETRDPERRQRVALESRAHGFRALFRAWGFGLRLLTLLLFVLLQFLRDSELLLDDELEDCLAIVDEALRCDDGITSR